MTAAYSPSGRESEPDGRTDVQVTWKALRKIQVCGANFFVFDRWVFLVLVCCVIGLAASLSQQAIIAVAVTGFNATGYRSSTRGRQYQLLDVEMASRRLPTRALDEDAGNYAGGSSGNNDGGADDSSPDAEISECSEMNESVVIGTKDLIKMLQSPGQDGDTEEHEGDMNSEEGDADEERDLAMDLDPRFKNADIKRKFSDALIEESDAREEHSGVPMHMAAGTCSLGKGSAGGGNGGGEGAMAISSEGAHESL